MAPDFAEVTPAQDWVQARVQARVQAPVQGWIPGGSRYLPANMPAHKRVFCCCQPRSVRTSPLIRSPGKVATSSTRAACSSSLPTGSHPLRPI